MDRPRVTRELWTPDTESRRRTEDESFDGGGRDSGTSNVIGLARQTAIHLVPTQDWVLPG